MSTVVAVTRIEIGFGDCDPAQIVYYPNYFSWCDRATHTLFQEAGIPLHELDTDPGVNVPIVDAQLQFRTPASWGDEIEIHSEISRWGSRSFTVSHRIVHAGGGDVVAEGHEARVCVRRDPVTKDISACEIPNVMREAFGA